MKKICICLSFFLATISMQACDNTEKNIPEGVQSSFAARYPGATNVEWEKHSENDATVYEAEFEINEEETKAYFDETGNFIREEED